jgi:hypothetical protein
MAPNLVVWTTMPIYAASVRLRGVDLEGRAAVVELQDGHEPISGQVSTRDGDPCRSPDGSS